jgi:hypothetical protein
MASCIINNGDIVKEIFGEKRNNQNQNEEETKEGDLRIDDYMTEIHNLHKKGSDRSQLEESNLRAVEKSFSDALKKALAFKNFTSLCLMTLIDSRTVFSEYTILCGSSISTSFITAPEFFV